MKNNRYLEFICRLSKIALKVGMGDFVDEWLQNNIDFDSPLPPVAVENNEEQNDENEEPIDPDEIDVKDLKRPVIPSLLGKYQQKFLKTKQAPFQQLHVYSTIH